MAAITKIACTNPNDLKYISKLSKRNDFYQWQLHAKMDGLFLENNSTYHTIHVKSYMFINEKYRKGLFLILNKKIIGCIIYQNLENAYAVLDFILIDTDNQKQGYGTILYQILENECIINKLEFIAVECEENSKEYYEKKFYYIGFVTELKKKEVEVENIPKNLMKKTNEEIDKLMLCLLHKCTKGKNNEFIYCYKVL